jgi:hypothetical protein
MEALTSYGRDAAIGGAFQVIGPWTVPQTPVGGVLVSWLERCYSPRTQTIRLVGYTHGTWGHLLRLEFWTKQGDFLTVNYVPGEHLAWPGTWRDWLGANASVYCYTGPRPLLESYLQAIVAGPT